MGVIDIVVNSVLIKIYGKKVGRQYLEKYVLREVDFYFIFLIIDICR